MCKLHGNFKIALEVFIWFKGMANIVIWLPSVMLDLWVFSLLQINRLGHHDAL
jgi:hypothetical protein